MFKRNKYDPLISTALFWIYIELIQSGDTCISFCKSKGLSTDILGIPLVCDFLFPYAK